MFGIFTSFGIVTFGIVTYGTITWCLVFVHSSVCFFEKETILFQQRVVIFKDFEKNYFF